MEQNKFFHKLNCTIHPFNIINDKVKLKVKGAIYPTGLSASGFRKAWADKLTGNKIIVAILDTGIDSSHPDLSGKVLNRINYYPNDKRLHPHGTHVAGIICARGLGVYGCAPNVSLLDMRVLNGDGSGSINNIISAIRLSADKGARVINMSLGATGLSEVEITGLRNAVDYAWSKGAVCVAASGNEGTETGTPDPYGYPASIDRVISVSASSVQENLEEISLGYFSNENIKVDISACGVNVYSCIPNGKYQIWSGTSMATPYVSAMVALLASQNKTAEQLVNALMNQIIPKEPTISFGRGYLRYKPETGPDNLTGLRPVYYEKIYYGSK